MANLAVAFWNAAYRSAFLPVTRSCERGDKPSVRVKTREFHDKLKNS
jgi:hypothetical protein